MHVFRAAAGEAKAAFDEAFPEARNFADFSAAILGNGWRFVEAANFAGEGEGETDNWR